MNVLDSSGKGTELVRRHQSSFGRSKTGGVDEVGCQGGDLWTAERWQGMFSFSLYTFFSLLENSFPLFMYSPLWLYYFYWMNEPFTHFVFFFPLLLFHLHLSFSLSLAKQNKLFALRGGVVLFVELPVPTRSGDRLAYSRYDPRRRHCRARPRRRQGRLERYGRVEGDG